MVGKFVELGWVEGVVGTGIGGGSSSELLNLLWGWVDVVLLKVSCDSDGELFLGNLTIVVGIDFLEDSIGLSIGDTWSSLSGNFDGSGGGDEGDKGEFHFDLI